MRNPETTKYDYGHGLLVAGAYGRMGCAILAARAALRSGCGLVTVHLPERCVDAMQAAFPEAMVSVDPSPLVFSQGPEHLERYTAMAAGPGLGTGETTQAALHKLLVQRREHVPMVLDADALNILALHREWMGLAAGCVVTPHAGEYGRLFGDADPAAMAVRHKMTIVRKAHRTRVYGADGRVYENGTGNAGMATAGSGDVLTGILLGMLAQGGGDVFERVCEGVSIHGKIGDLATSKQSESSLLASDMVENLRFVSVESTMGCK